MFAAAPRATPDDGEGRWLWMAAGLALGILGGFAGGFVVGQRDTTPAPITVQSPVSRSDGSPLPAPTMGQDYSDSAVAPTPVEDPPVKPTERPATGAAPPPRTTAADSAPAAEAQQTPADFGGIETRSDRREALAGPGAIEFVSRPAGAQILLDGRVIGRTPLILSDVRPGQYAVRLALPEHRRWETTVDVAPGTRARVAASLEK
jgi:hypothetical protein